MASQISRLTPTDLVDASAAASGTATVPNSDQFAMHRITFRTNGSAVSFQIQHAPNVDGDVWSDLMDAAVTDASTATQKVVEMAGLYKNLRVSWSGNDGTVYVYLEQCWRQMSAAGPAI